MLTSLPVSFSTVSQGDTNGRGREGPTNTSFKISGPAFVEPEVFPGSVGDEIATPAMRKLVGNYIDVLTILNNNHELSSQLQTASTKQSTVHTLEIMLGVANV